ncbi:uncharacterized protein TNCV_4792201 [Trichonephila clavipes]|nr:uncharacterized protein TNCV_4792201 [Trichonephila clavipes]
MAKILVFGTEGTQIESSFKLKKTLNGVRKKLQLIFFITETRAKSAPEHDAIGNVNEEVVELARKINLEVDNDDIKELLDSHYQELKNLESGVPTQVRIKGLTGDIQIDNNGQRSHFTVDLLKLKTKGIVKELWFQQDGATYHTARATIDLLKDTFGDRLISRFGPVNWPPRSCDLTPLDYFLRGYVKSLVYADKPQTLDHLEDNIRRVIADIWPQMLEKVIENWTSRLDYIRASRGSHMPEIIFKM